MLSSTRLSPRRASVGSGWRFSTVNAELLVKSRENSAAGTSGLHQRCSRSYTKAALLQKPRWKGPPAGGEKDGRPKDAASFQKPAVARRCLFRQPVLHPCSRLICMQQGAVSPAGGALPAPPQLLRPPGRAGASICCFSLVDYPPTHPMELIDRFAFVFLKPP